MMLRSWDGRVVGVSFVDPDNVKRARLRQICEERGLVNPGEFDPVENVAVVLIRNPGNEFDSNAVQVHVPALGDNAMLGHLPRSIAVELAPLMDAGGRFQAALTGIFVADVAPNNYGIAVAVWEVAADA